MSSLYAQLQSFTIAGSGANLGDATLILTTFTQINGTLLTMADFGTKGFITIQPNSKDFEEQISFSGVTQNANGTATLTGVKTVLMVSPYTETPNLAKSHPGGALCVVSNTSGFYNRVATKDNDETITGKWTFPVANWPIVDNGATLPALQAQLATKAYVDSVAIAGAPNATTAVKGISQLATDAQLQAGTEIGSTGASLVAHGSNHSQASAANKVPVGDASGKLAAGWGGAASTLATLDAGSLVVQNPTNATATPTAAKIPIADGSGKLDAWVTGSTNSSLTTGEAINGTATVPLAVCVKPSDGLIYKAKGNDSTLVSTYGFINTNALITTTPAVVVSGILGGFSALVKGAQYYVQDTAGTIGVTPSTTTQIPVGRAISATQIELNFGKKVSFGTLTHSAAPNVTDSQTATIGFQAASVDLIYDLATSGGSTLAELRGTMRAVGTSFFGGSVIKQDGVGTAINTSTLVDLYIFTTQVQFAGGGGNKSTVTMTISSITANTFVSQMANTIGAGLGATGIGTVKYIAYE